MTESTGVPDRLGPIGARLRARALHALSAAQAGGVQPEALDNDQGPLGARLRKHAQDVAEDEDVQDLLGDAAWEVGTSALSDLIGHAPGLAVEAIQAVGEAIADAFTD